MPFTTGTAITLYYEIHGDGEPVIFKYTPMLPESVNAEVGIALVIMIAGVLTIWITESIAARTKD